MNTLKISDNFLQKLAFFYIGLPFLIFVFGWLHWYIAWPFGIIFIASLFFSLENYTADNKVVNSIQNQKYILISALIIILVYTFFSGIGGYSFQNEDHHYRNAIFQDLVRKPWPVLYQIKGFAAENPLEGSQSMLVYYLGYWLPAAVVGKLMGLEAGRFFLFVWTVLGFLLVYYNLCQYFQKYSLKILWLFIAWGSLYFIGTFCTFPLKDVLKGEAYLWAGFLLFADGTTGLIYWTFNQTIVPWLIILLIMNQFNTRNVIFLTSLLFFSGPFAFMGFIPFFVYFMVKKDFANLVLLKDVYFIIKKYLSFTNIFGAILVVLVTYLYFSANSSGNVFNLVVPSLTTYFVFIFLSIGIISILIFDRNKSNPLYYLLIGVLLILPFFQLGFGLDFTARASIPAMFILMLLVGDYLIKSENSIRKNAVILYVIIAGLGHNLQFVRSVYFTGLQAVSQSYWGNSLAKSQSGIVKNIGERMLANKGKNITIKNNLDSLNNPKNVLLRNFMGNTEHSFFYNYLAKKSVKNEQY